MGAGPRRGADVRRRQISPGGCTSTTTACSTSIIERWPVLPCLGDDNPRWRPDSFGYRRWGTEVGIRFPAVKLLDYLPRRAELEQSSNPFATVVLAHLDTLETRQDQGERKDRKFRLVKGLYERGWNRERIEALFRLIDWIMELPTEMEIELSEQVAKYQKEKRMPHVSSMERYGLYKGRLEGIEGMLELKFGETGLHLMPEIREIKDDDKLEAILRAIKTAATPDDVRRLWADGK